MKIINQEIKQIIATVLDTPVAGIEDNHSLVWDLHADSMNLTEIVCHLEGRFDIAIVNHEVGADPTVASLSAIVAQRIASKAQDEAVR
ncbi:acyl carrier protein [Pantoea sp. Acro-807]|uniref:acyl carrier protein n=1 Tax=Pantoea sp. Acro-807 TaxID=2608356 RepID=UPI001419F375|nr:acyl carrier protein [Pantoea sp. Acro-807]NIE72336.1 acyl carrier protein [Pantoea sp. Acro-807]